MTKPLQRRQQQPPAKKRGLVVSKNRPEQCCHCLDGDFAQIAAQWHIEKEAQKAAGNGGQAIMKQARNDGAQTHENLHLMPMELAYTSFHWKMNCF